MRITCLSKLYCINVGQVKSRATGHDLAAPFVHLTVRLRIFLRDADGIADSLVDQIAYFCG